jgi:Oxysterol-binding protein
VSAYHCSNENYEIWTSAGTTLKFNGRYATFAPKDKIYIKLTLSDGTQEEYSGTLPVVTIHNLVIGKLYIEIVGKSLIINHNNQESCELDFKERGWSGKNANHFSGSTKLASSGKSGTGTYKVFGVFN